MNLGFSRKFKIQFLLAAVCTIVVLLAGICFGALPEYEVTDLGNLGGLYSAAYGINDAGQVVGMSMNADYSSNAFIWDSINGMTGLGTLGGNNSYAWAVNDNGLVVGNSAIDEGGFLSHAFVWDSTNGMVDIGTLDGDLILANGINNAGQVVGEYLTSGGVQRAFIWDDINGMVDLGLDFGRACAINDAGQVVGGAESAFIWDSTNGVTYLDSLGKHAVAQAINEVGQVAGNVYEPYSIVSRAVLWDSTNGMIDLGTLGRDSSQAWGINDFGQVVGNAIDHGLYGGFVPFLWDSQNGMVNLNSLLSVNSSWAQISSVYDINNRGQIVGGGSVSGDSGTHAFLITPIPQPQTYYVDDDAPDDPVHGDPSSSDPLEDGSMAHPFDAIQEAIDAAYDGDTVLVADGTYTGLGNRDIEVSTKGITICSLNGPENCIIDCNATEGYPHRGFYFHSNQDSNSILSGFTITKGYSWSVIGGAGITSQDSRLTISDCNIRGNKVFGSRSGFSSGISLIEGIYFINNCTITENATKIAGSDCGALYSRSSGNGHITISNCTITNNQNVGIRCENSELMITDCTISGNTTGGVYCEDGNSTITGCKIIGNGYAPFDPFTRSTSGINCKNSSPIINNCTINYNSALYGGGVYCEGESNINNCRITGNFAYQGGGICCMELTGEELTVKNCIITSNIAKDGGGIRCWGGPLVVKNSTITGNLADHQGGGIYMPAPGLQTTNCIIWSNIPSQLSIGRESSFPLPPNFYTINYNCIEDWTAGEWQGYGNIDSDPCFVAHGYWDGELWVDGDYHLLSGSPCIDAGDPNYILDPNQTDFDGNPRVIGGRIDMGAYEFMPPIEVQMKFTPQALNLSSGGKLVKAHFTLPEEFSIEDVDVNTPAVIEPYGIESYKIKVILNDEGLVRVEATFSRSDLCAAITVYDQSIEVKVTGSLTTGQQFYGTDIIKITDRAFEHLALFVSYWLEANCIEPDWCDGADLNADSVVNFLDFALLDRCCIEVTEE